MRKFMQVALFGLFPLMLLPGVQASEQPASAQQQVINARGVVKQIDLANKKITIAHDAIPVLGWPAMTMRFTFITEDASIGALKVGATVSFSFIQQGNISLLQEIKVS